MKKQLQGRRRSLIASFVASALASAAAASVGAQEGGATLEGKTDPNAEVTAKNVDTGLTRHTKAGADGSYTILGLPAGTYAVDAGPGTEQTVTLSVASTEVLDLGKLQTVTVSGARIVETRTSEIGAIVSLHDIETVPQLTRNFLEFADTVPGVAFTVDHNFHTSIRGGAQNDNSVNVYIDGVGQKGYVRSGLAGQSDQTQGNPFPQMAIGEYKVITSNYKAEYDQISSAAITAETRSGTNRFEGEVYGLYTSDHFRAETPGELATTNPNIKSPSKDKEFGLAFGGPIIKDVAHFFVTYEGKRYQQPVTVNIAGNVPANVVAQLPAEALAQLGPAQLNFTENLYFGKVDWEPTADDRFVLESKVRRETGDGGIGTGLAKSTSIVAGNDDTRVDLRWQRSADRWFNEVLLTYEDTFYNPAGATPGTTNGATYTYKVTNDSAILATDGIDPRAFQNKGQKGYALADELTFSHLKFWTGDHTVKMGIKHKWVKLTAQDGSATNNPIFFYDTSAAGTNTIPWKATFAAVTAGSSPVVTSSDRQLGVFLQDDWVANDKLTVNLGVRWDIEWNPSYLNWVTPQFFINELNTPDPGCQQAAYAAQCSPGQTYGQSLVKGGVNPADYLGTGNNRSVYAGEFQPRLGFSYDLNADQRHVVFGGFGRSYDRDLYDYLQLEQTKIALSEPTVRFNTTDHPCTVANPPTPACEPWDPKYLNGVQNLQALVAGAAGEVDMLNNHLKVPYSDQFSLGIRNRLGDWNTTTALAWINSYDGLVFTLGNRRPDGSFWGPVPWGGPAQPWLYAPPGLAGNLIIGNNGIKTRTKQLLLSADKPFTRESHWGTTIAYTYTDATHNRDINEHYAFDGEYIGSYPYIVSNAVSKHRIVATASYEAPWGFVIGGKLTVASPIPKNDIEYLTAAGAHFTSGAPGMAVGYTAPGTGYRSVDMQITKNFNIRDVSTMYVRFDVLNIFNVKNYIDYLNAVAPSGVITGGNYDPHGNIAGYPRELRMSIGAKF